MPWSSPSTSATGPPAIELIDPEQSPRVERKGGGKPVLALMAVAAAIGLGLMLLPEPAVPEAPAGLTLPAPASVTSLPDRNRITVGVIVQESWPLRLVPSLGGLTNLVGPARSSAGPWWLIAGGANAPELLSSTDGRKWEALGALPFERPEDTYVGDLISNDGVLIAAGRVRVMDDAVRIHRLQTWHSSDGLIWIPDLVATGMAFSDVDVVAAGDSVLVTARDGNGNDRVFRSTTFGKWDEIVIEVSSLREIVAAPQGGFLASAASGRVYTSAYGVIWQPNDSIEAGLYTQFGDGAMGISLTSTTPTIELLTPDRRDRLVLPEELAGCEFRGGEAGFLAFCKLTQPARYRVLLSQDGSTWQPAQSELLTDSLAYLGETEAGFLLTATNAAGSAVVILASL